MCDRFESRGPLMMLFLIPQQWEFRWAESFNHNITAQIQRLLPFSPLRPQSLPPLSFPVRSPLSPNGSKYYKIQKNTQEPYRQPQGKRSGGWRQALCGRSHHLSHYHSSNQEQERSRGNGCDDRQSLKLG